MYCTTRASGDFSVVLNGVTIANIGFACHLKGWSPKSASLVGVIQSSPSNLEIKSKIDANTSTISIITSLNVYDQLS